GILETRRRLAARLSSQSNAERAAVDLFAVEGHAGLGGREVIFEGDVREAATATVVADHHARVGHRSELAKYRPELAIVDLLLESSDVERHSHALVPPHPTPIRRRRIA